MFDALAAVRLVREFGAGLSFDAFVSNVLVRSAVERQLEIPGEAYQRMVQDDPEIRERFPEVGFAIGLRRASDLPFRVDLVEADALAAGIAERVAAESVALPGW